MPKKMETTAPSKKVITGSLAAAVSAAIVSFLDTNLIGIDDGLKAAVITIVTYITGYYTSPGEKDNVVDA